MTLSILRTKLTALEILKASLVDLGFPIKVCAEIRVSYGETKLVDIVAVLDGNSDLGWLLNDDGSIDVVVDACGISKIHDPMLLISSINQKYADNQRLADLIS